MRIDTTSAWSSRQNIQQESDKQIDKGEATCTCLIYTIPTRSYLFASWDGIEIYNMDIEYTVLMGICT